MAITKVSDLTSEFVDILLAKMIAQHDDRYVFRDLGLVADQTEILGAAGSHKGTVFKLNQIEHLSGTYTESSRRLTDGTAVSTTPIVLTNPTQYTVTLREYGGPYDTNGVYPIGLTEMLQRRAQHDVAAWAGEQLKRDLLKHQDKTICDLALTTSNQVTADAVAAGSITAGKKMSYEMLTRVEYDLSNRNIPRFPNGRYRGIISPRNKQELQNDGDLLSLAKSQDASVSMITSGYVGTVSGIDLFESTLIPTANVGSGSAVTGYQSVFFGSGGFVGLIEGLPPEPRFKDDTDYGRSLAVLWYSIAGWAALDLDWCTKGLTT